MCLGRHGSQHLEEIIYIDSSRQSLQISEHQPPHPDWLLLLRELSVAILPIDRSRIGLPRRKLILYMIFSKPDVVETFSHSFRHFNIRFGNLCFQFLGLSIATQAMGEASPWTKKNWTLLLWKEQASWLLQPVRFATSYVSG